MHSGCIRNVSCAQILPLTKNSPTTFSSSTSHTFCSRREKGDKELERIRCTVLLMLQLPRYPHKHEAFATFMILGTAQNGEFLKEQIFFSWWVQFITVRIETPDQNYTVKWAHWEKWCSVLLWKLPTEGELTYIVDSGPRKWVVRGGSVHGTGAWEKLEGLIPLPTQIRGLTFHPQWINGGLKKCEMFDDDDNNNNKTENFREGKGFKGIMPDDSWKWWMSLGFL